MLIIEPIPAFTDNYIWLLTCQGDRRAWVVDPGDAGPVLAVLRQQQLILEGVLLTHHHGDHNGGIPELLRHFPALRIIGGPANQYASGEMVTLLDTAFEVINVPGHTLDHVAFYSRTEHALFCGDTLFAGGCGRLFEGTPAQMHHSLEVIAALPGETRIYCAHEYTLSNLRFALAVEPDNLELQQRFATDQMTRKQGKPTVPSRLSLEKQTNPFLRCHQTPVITAAEARAQQHLATRVEVFTVIRAWKDTF